jgi:hypothetical protein
VDNIVVRDNCYVVMDYAFGDRPLSLKNWVENPYIYSGLPASDNTVQMLVVEPSQGIPDDFDWLVLFPSLLYVNHMD